MGKIVCIDPGHNGSGRDTGAEGNGLKEQDLNLDISLQLRTFLQANGFTVVMTREGQLVKDNSTLNASLQSRIDVAENAGADLFVSVHINAGGGTGVEVLVYALGGESEKCANAVLPYLVSAGGWRNRGVKVQNVMVLRETTMPAILGETGFIDNASDATKLAESEFRQSLARAYCQGICTYFGIAYQDKEATSVLEVAVLLNTKEDYWAGADVAVRNGNCAVFVRGSDKSIPADAMSAEKLIVVGGTSTKHPNEVLLSGNTKYDTAAAVAKYLS